MTVNDKVESLRKLLEEKALSAWLINGTDPHQSEYVCPRWQSRKWISGFTGSAGFVVVTAQDAILWVDSRYFVQAAQQIQGTCFVMKKLDGPEASSPVAWLQKKFSNGEKIGIDGSTLMESEKRNYQAKGLNVVPEKDLLDLIWKDRPAVPDNEVVVLDNDLCGESVEEKIERVRQACHQRGCGYTIISSLDDIAWTLNLRGSDVQYTPVFLSHLLIGKDKVQLFTPPVRFANVKPNGPFEVLPYEAINAELEKIGSKESIYLNPERINSSLYGSLKKDVKVVEGREFTTDFKACKNETELDGMREAHVLDGIALVNFLAMVKRGEFDFTELSIAQALEDERMCEEDCLGASFSSIAGFAEHGALCHYSATKETDKEIKGNGLLVLDTGGMYRTGMTDVTRTILFGEATEEQKEDYTMVLKGNLAMASQVFPAGTTGIQIDTLARQFLWQKGLAYYHGTGHGVGFRLSVHEGPQRISTAGNALTVALKPGMVVSDEPGIYKEGRHGIRIENLVAVVKAFDTEFGEFLTFEVLTLCPFERELILKDMLTEDEISMVDSYHKWVYETLKDMVNEDALDYLMEATKPL